MAQTQPWNFILGVRDTVQVQRAFDGLKYDTSKHRLTLLPLDLSQFKNVKTFAQQTLGKLGSAGKIDYLLLNAGLAKGAEKSGFHPKWCESYIVNHLAQHYLLHLLNDKLVESRSRIIFVSSGAVRNVKDTSKTEYVSLFRLIADQISGTLENTVRDGSGAEYFAIYAATKFQQLLGAHWWRQKLAGTCTVVAVSPGLVPGTGLGRHTDMKLDPSMPDAISIPQSKPRVYIAADNLVVW